MDGRSLVGLEGLLSVLSSDVPNDLIDCIIIQLVEDSIRANQHIVKAVNAIFFIDDLRLTGDNSFAATQETNLGLTVTESTADRESTREDSVRPHKWVIIVI